MMKGGTRVWPSPKRARRVDMQARGLFKVLYMSISLR